MLRSTLLVLLALACSGAAAAVVAPEPSRAHPRDGPTDADHDGVDDPPVGEDNCAGEDGAFNPGQGDLDRDGYGDACDVDDDGDNADDALDNCPSAKNASQLDLDGDNAGDACDLDDDGDGRADGRDNCRFVQNHGQGDADRDGLGDACDGARRRDVPGATDGASPDVSVPLRARHRSADLAGGLAVPVSCSERCTVSSRLAVGARDARRLRSRRVLGSGGAELDAAGETFVFIRLPGGALRRIGRVRAVLHVEATDVAGNRRTLTRRLTIRR